ncbi:MAG: hypothetical protein KKB50_20505 [Planctomycetes bacterium]|nr:hypothetical protein [Planctomycetota bacterium]
MSTRPLCASGSARGGEGRRRAALTAALLAGMLCLPAAETKPLVPTHFQRQALARWGDRYGKLTDAYEHKWSLATHVEDLTPEEIAKRGAAAIAQSGACHE